MLQLYSETIQILIHLLELAGSMVIVGGFLLGAASYLARVRSCPSHALYLEFRRRSVRGLILGLEFLVAADIIKTVTVDYTLESVLILALIVLIRSFLVFALHLEIEGRLPWVRTPESEDDEEAR